MFLLAARNGTARSTARFYCRHHCEKQWNENRIFDQVEANAARQDKARVVGESPWSGGLLGRTIWHCQPCDLRVCCPMYSPHGGTDITERSVVQIHYREALGSDSATNLVMRENMSTGTGKTRVVFFSTPISVNVCR